MVPLGLLSARPMAQALRLLFEYNILYNNKNENNNNINKNYNNNIIDDCNRLRIFDVENNYFYK